MDANDRTRPRRVGAALAGAAVGVAGLTGSLLLLGQSADATAVNEATEAEHGEFEQGDVEQLQEEWAAFDACLVDQGVLTDDDLEDMYAEDFDEWDEEYDDEAWISGFPTVAVENGDQLTFVDFGDGDGTVTIEKVGDEITVSSTGDVTQEDIDLAELEAEFEGDFEEFDGDEWADFEGDDEYLDLDELDADLQAEFEQWDNAIEACADLAPEDGLDFDGDVIIDGDVEDEETAD